MSNKSWYHANKEKAKAYARKWYHANKKRVARTNKLWKSKNKAKVLSYHQRWYYSPAGRAYLKRTAEHRRKYHLRSWAMDPSKSILAARSWYARHGIAYKRMWNKKHRERVRAQGKKWYRSNPNRVRLYHIVGKAKERGEIAWKPCEKCGAIDGVHATHKGHRRPLDVTWLCRKHRGETMRRMPSLIERAKALAASL